MMGINTLFEESFNEIASKTVSRCFRSHRQQCYDSLLVAELELEQHKRDTKYARILFGTWESFQTDEVFARRATVW